MRSRWTERSATEYSQDARRTRRRGSVSTGVRRPISVTSPRTQPLTVVITVRNEGEGLRELLPALAAKTKTPNEIVIVDGGSVDGTLEAVAGFDLPVRTIVAPGANIAAGRNIGVRAARNELIACTDAGCRPDPGWLAALHECLERADIIGGVFVAEGQTQLERIASLTHYPIPQELDRPSASVRLSDPPFGRQQQTFGAGTRSMAFRRRALQAAGGFPERQYAGEDQAFALWAIDSGFTAAFARDAVVHWRPPGNWSANARMFYLHCRGDIRSRGRSRHLLRLLAWTVGPAAALPGRREARALVAAGAAAYISLPLRRARVARLDRGYWWRIPIAVAVKDISQIAGAAHETVDALRGVPQPTPQPPAPMAGERSSTALTCSTSVAEQRAVEHAIRVHSQQAGRFANWYEAPHVTASGTCFAFSRRRLQDRLTEYLPPPGTRAAVLDVGCGTGEQMAHLRSLGFHVTGVDGRRDAQVCAIPQSWTPL